MAKMMKNNYLNLFFMLLLIFFNACNCNKVPSLRTDKPYEQIAPLPPKKYPLEGIFVDAANKALDESAQDGKTWATAYSRIQQAIDAADKDIHTNIIIAKGNYALENITIDHKSISIMGSYPNNATEFKIFTIGKDLPLDNYNNWTVIGEDTDTVDAPVFSIKNGAKKVSISGIRFQGKYEGRAIKVDNSASVDKQLSLNLRALSIIGGANKDYAKISGIEVNGANKLSINGFYCAGVGDDSIYGGCIDVKNTNTVDIKYADFANNKASLGGALLADNIKNFVIKNSSFKDLAAFEGGALYLTKIANASLSGCKFSNNRSTDKAGAVFFYRTNLINISASKFINNTSVKAAAFYVYKATNFIFKNSTISDSNTSYGFQIDKAESITLDNATITDNKAGGFKLSNASEKIIIKNSTISANKNSSGAIIKNSAALVEITKSNFSANEANKGAALYLSNNQNEIIISDSEFTHNKALKKGGALYIQANYDTSRVILTGKTLFSSNNAKEEKGGGAIYFIAAGKFSGSKYPIKPTKEVDTGLKTRATLIVDTDIASFTNNTTGDAVIDPDDPTKPAKGNIGNSIYVIKNGSKLKDIVEFRKSSLTKTEDKEVAGD